MTHQLYDLLPMIYRERDAAQGGALLAFMEVVGRGYDVLRDDIDQLYDNWFIETCDPAIVPFIARLLDLPGIDHPFRGPPDLRRSVANAIAHRRRKGTAAALAGASADATGWSVRVVESLSLLSTTQDLAQIRTASATTVDLRKVPDTEALFGPFATATHGFSLRQGSPLPAPVTPQPVSPEGAYAPSAIGLFLWRLQSFPASSQELRLAGGGRFFFNPMGVNAPLFTPTARNPEPGQQIPKDAVPQAISRRKLQASLAETPQSRAFSLWADWGDGRKAIDPADVLSGDLADWDVAPRTGDHVATVDPETGRLLFLGEPPKRVWASFSYGAPGALGGGPYERPAGRQAIGRTSRSVSVAGGGSLDVTAAFNSVKDNGEDVAIVITDSDIYRLSDQTVIHVPGGCHLSIVAANGTQPTLIGALTVQADGPGATFSLDGIRLDGRLRISGSVKVVATDATLCIPGALSGSHKLRLNGHSGAPTLHLRRCICGPVEVSEADSDVLIEDSIVDGGGGFAVRSALSGTQDPSHGLSCRIVRSTILGQIHLRELVEASDSLLLGEVRLMNGLRGYSRFSYALQTSPPFMRYRCLPETNLPEPGETPTLTSRQYGHPAYCQLDFDCPKAVQHGAANGSEMGVWNSQNNLRRVAALATCLEHYVPLGMRSQVFYVN